MATAATRDADSLQSLFHTLMPWRWPAEHAASWRASLPTHQRAVVSAVVEALLDPHDRRHTVLIGLRRIGKTVAMEQCVQALLDRGIAAERLLWLRLDHPQLADFELGMVETLVQNLRATETEPAYLFLDEVTAGKHWDRWLKALYDDKIPVRIVATSSATSMLRVVRQESGAGRWREIVMSPWLVHELAALVGTRLPRVDGDLHAVLSTLPEAFLDSALTMYAKQAGDFGGFPEWWPGHDHAQTFDRHVFRAQERLRSDIVQNAIYRDLTLAVNVDRPDKLEQLLQVLAAQIAQLASPQTLAQTIGVTQPTVDRYLSHLEAIHLLFRLYNFAPTEEAVQRRGRKVFLADNALRNAVLGRVPWATSDDDAGHLRENQVAVHLEAYANRRQTRLYYWRDSKKREVDFVIAEPAAPVAIEVASGPGHRRDGLRALAALRPEFAGRQWITWPDAPLTLPAADPDGIGSCPTSTLLAVAGALADAALER